MKKIFLFLMAVASISFAYLPGETGFVSLDDDHGLFENPASLNAFDSKGALLDYRYNKEISEFRIGGNLDHWGASFDYRENGSALDESRWNLIYSTDFFSRIFFSGSRVTAFRSADFKGTEWSLSQGFLLRPFRFMSLGYSCENLLYVGPESMSRIQNVGATLRLGSFLSASYDLEDWKEHRLLLELGLYNFRVGFKMPLYGDDDEYALTISTTIGGYMNASVTSFGEYYPKRGALGYHRSRNPYAATTAQIVRVPLNTTVSEVENDFVLFRKNSIGILKIRSLFEHLLRDPSCGLVVLDFAGYKGNLGVSYEINRLIMKHRARGGKVVAYLDDVRPATLLAASSADRIVVEPSAHFTWRGLGGSINYYKGLFDKIGVKVEFLRHGAYKSAVEPYIADSMSVEARDNMETLYGDIWTTVSSNIAWGRRGRGNTLENRAHLLDSIAAKPMVTAKYAKTAGLVDTMLYIDQVPAYALKTFFDLEAPYAKFTTWSLTERKIFDESWSRRARIALLNIDGTIDGRMERSVVEKLRILPNTDAQALIIRISSPGGSAIASDKIWHAVRNVSAQGIPVIASIGSIGASGAYYIACGADEIIAEPFSIVGSIGIYGGKIDVSGLLGKIGVRSEFVKTHEHADAETFNRSWTAEERAALQEYMDDFYERFTGIVSRATKIPQATVDSSYGGGRVFVGHKAYKAGLVHGLGGLDFAIGSARKRAQISPSTEIELFQLDTEKSYIVPLPGSRSFADMVQDLGETQFWAIDPNFWGEE